MRYEHSDDVNGILRRSTYQGSAAKLNLSLYHPWLAQCFIYCILSVYSLTSCKKVWMVNNLLTGTLTLDTNRLLIHSHITDPCDSAVEDRSLVKFSASPSVVGTGQTGCHSEGVVHGPRCASTQPLGINMYCIQAH